MPATDVLIADFYSALTAGEMKLTRFLRERVFKYTSIYASVPLSKRLTSAKGTDTTKPGEDLKAKAMEMERDALKAVINLVEVSELVDLNELLEHRVVEECVALLNCNGAYHDTGIPRRASSSRNSLCNM